MRKLLISTVILFGFFIMFLILKNNHSNIPEIDVSNPNLIEIPFSKNEIVNRINNKNKKINSILIKNMPIKAKNGRMTFKLTGDLAHSKDKFFRFIVTSKITGKEMDIGSNNDIFWFWSKRISPPALYFSKHEDLWKTNLKTPLNPAWMIESLNINLIDQNNQIIFKQDLDNLIKILIKNQFVFSDKNNIDNYCQWIITNNNNNIIEYFMITEIIYL